MIHTAKWAAAKLYTIKTPITTEDLLNERVLPFFTSEELGSIRMLTNRAPEYCSKLETHNYGLYLAINGIKHTKSKAHHPQTNAICEHFHKTVLNEFYPIVFRANCILLWRSYNKIWLHGWMNIIWSEHIRQNVLQKDAHANTA